MEYTYFIERAEMHYLEQLAQHVRAAHDSKETVSNTRDIELRGGEMLKEERGEDTSGAGRAARTIDMTLKDIRLQRQLHSAQAPFAQT